MSDAIIASVLQNSSSLNWDLIATESNTDGDIAVSIPVAVNDYNIFYAIGYNNTSINYAGWTLYFWIGNVALNKGGNATYDPCTVQSSLFFREIFNDGSVQFRSCNGDVFKNNNNFAKLGSQDGITISGSAGQITINFYGIK